MMLMAVWAASQRMGQVSWQGAAMAPLAVVGGLFNYLAEAATVLAHINYNNVNGSSTVKTPMRLCIILSICNA